MHRGLPSQQVPMRVVHSAPSLWDLLDMLHLLHVLEHVLVSLSSPRLEVLVRDNEQHTEEHDASYAPEGLGRPEHHRVRRRVPSSPSVLRVFMRVLPHVFLIFFIGLLKVLGHLFEAGPSLRVASSCLLEELFEEVLLLLVLVTAV